jgi:hypothetical protein
MEAKPKPNRSETTKRNRGETDTREEKRSKVKGKPNGGETKAKWTGNRSEVKF